MYLKQLSFLLFYIFLGRVNFAEASNLRDNEDFKCWIIPHFQISLFSEGDIPPEAELKEEFITQLRILENTAANEQEKEQATNILTNLAIIGFSPLLNFSLLPDRKNYSQRASFIINTLSYQLTTVACGEIGYRIIREFSMEDPQFLSKDFSWYWDNLENISPSFIHSFISGMQQDPDETFLKQRLTYCLAVGYMWKALEGYSIKNDDILKANSFLTELDSTLNQAGQFLYNEDSILTLEQIFLLQSQKERYAENVYSLMAKLTSFMIDKEFAKIIEDMCKRKIEQLKPAWHDLEETGNFMIEFNGPQVRFLNN